ncbi:MAG: hypothetical protein ACKOQ5_05810 [Solirubrobacterales bacterium]
MSERAKEEEHPAGAFPWRPAGTWGIGQEIDQPEVILVDAGAESIGQKGRRSGPVRDRRGRPRKPEPRVEHDPFDRFTLALSASLARARQRCEAEGRRSGGTVVVEVRGRRHPHRDR